MPLFQTKTYGKDNKKVVLVFTGWSNPQILFWFLGKVLESYGFKAIVYTYSPSILSPNPEQTQKNFRRVVDDAKKRVTSLPKKEQKNLAVFGTSLGSAFAFMLASELPTVKKVIANLIGADLAEIVWSWENMQKKLKKKITKEQLQDLWFDLNPINNMETFSNKQLLLYAAEHDEIIPFAEAKKLIGRCKEDHLEYEAIINSRHHHLASATINILRFQTYIDFLQTS